MPFSSPPLLAGGQKTSLDLSGVKLLCGTLGCASWLPLAHKSEVPPLHQQVDHVRAERNVLAEVHNPYIVKLLYSFQVRSASIMLLLLWLVCICCGVSLPLISLSDDTTCTAPPD